MTQKTSSWFMDELRIIPMGWNVAAVVGFICADVFFGHLIPRWVHRHDLPREPFWGLIAFACAVLVGLMIALTGYVYADAKRRGMRAVLWVVLIILLPKGIGFI